MTACRAFLAGLALALLTIPLALAEALQVGAPAPAMRVDAFVQCVGTAASLRGIATVLKRHKPGVKIVAVEPAESSVLLGGQPGPHKIEGIGIGYVPPLWEPNLVDEIVPIRTDDAKAMARRIAREEALFAGTSSGANVLAAIQGGGWDQVPR